MTFKTVDEAYQFYSYYAYRIGFGIAKTCSRRKDGVQHEYTFSCEKSGKPKDKKGLTPKRTRISKKTGCQAKFRVRLNEDGLWHLAFLVLHHNHYCSPNESHRYRSHKMTPFHAMPYDGQRLSEGYTPAEAAALSVAQLDSLTGDGHAVDLADGACRFRLREGDAQAIAEYLARMQKESPLFFHLMDLDGEGRLQNIFWADTRSRMSYPYFNDVILLDTSCLSSKNGSIPFASFTGVNHHGSAVPETYAWLFQAWLASMGGLPPRAIITDKSKSIDSAVLGIFPNTLHRLCIGQIMKRIPEALAGRSNQKAAKERLHNIVFDSLKPDEFEENWAAMINEFKLGDSEWLLSLYKERRRWVPTFVKDTFWAGMSGIQRSDIRAPYFDRFVTSKSSLKQFLPAFEAALLARYNKEFQEEHGGEFQALPPPLISRLSMEEDFSKAYTLNMFQRFQQELQKCVDCTCILIRKDGAISTYQVKERVKQRTYSYEVLFNEDQVEVQCLCRGFEFGGILCSHAIVVLKEKDVQRAPPRFF
ncbi:unnamed protein product [Spirodela intermedia]|uniref:Protein FAR1-RELATED SEQUENCE n=1 Tax=Spirodela intermedia TaxID=51605 RepID=A0A7I8JHD0_SPIIN|nr:unnamed protein product [Spirodela intermedia]CAA6668953.1 unnamed protein product [Spirodela intermedia]